MADNWQIINIKGNPGYLDLYGLGLGNFVDEFGFSYIEIEESQFWNITKCYN